MINYNKVIAELKLKWCCFACNINIIPNEILLKIFKHLTAFDLLKWSEVCRRFYDLVNYKIFWIKRISEEFRYKIEEKEDLETGNVEYYGVSKYNPRHRAYKKLPHKVFIEHPIKFYTDLSIEKFKKTFVPIRNHHFRECAPIVIKKMVTGMINSNFEIHFNIDQEVLIKILQNDPYNMFANKETHPAVKIKYMCTSDNGQCYKAATILAFRTGKVIITGVKSRELLDNAYTFINSVFKKHYKELYQLPDYKPPKKKAKKAKQEVNMNWN